MSLKRKGLQNASYIVRITSPKGDKRIYAEEIVDNIRGRTIDIAKEKPSLAWFLDLDDLKESLAWCLNCWGHKTRIAWHSTGKISHGIVYLFA